MTRRTVGQVRRAKKSQGRGITLAPERESVVRSGGWTFRRAEVDPDWIAPPGASHDMMVAIETHPDVRTREQGQLVVAVELELRGGPRNHDGDETSTEEIRLHAADLPAFIGSLVRAAFIAQRDDVLPRFDDAGFALINDLNAVLRPED